MRLHYFLIKIVKMYFKNVKTPKDHNEKQHKKHLISKSCRSQVIPASIALNLMDEFPPQLGILNHFLNIPKRQIVNFKLWFGFFNRSLSSDRQFTLWLFLCVHKCNQTFLL